MRGRLALGKPKIKVRLHFDSHPLPCGLLSVNNRSCSPRRTEKSPTNKPIRDDEDDADAPQAVIPRPQPRNPGSAGRPGTSGIPRLRPRNDRDVDRPAPIEFGMSLELPLT